MLRKSGAPTIAFALLRQPPQTHLRELVAQSSHGRPARSPTNVAWHRLPLPGKIWPARAVRVRDHVVGMRERR